MIPSARVPPDWVSDTHTAELILIFWGPYQERGEFGHHQGRKEPEYFQMLLIELWIYFDDPRDELFQQSSLFWLKFTNQASFADF